MKMCRGKSFFSFSAKLLLMLCFFQICATTDNKQRCAPSSCGKITNISHPFRLKNDPATCGDPKYELACENNRTVLTIFSGKYYVKSINYKNFTIRLVDPGIKEADCSSTPRYFLSETNFTSERVDGYKLADYFYFMPNYVIYLNCSKAVKDDPYYVELPLPCNFNSQSPALHLSATASESDIKHRYSYEEIHRMLNYGFDLSWFPGACENACGEKECYYRSFHEGATLELHCGILQKLLLFLEDFLFGIAKEIGAIIHGEPYNEATDITGSELATETGRVTGRYNMGGADPGAFSKGEKLEESKIRACMEKIGVPIRIPIFLYLTISLWIIFPNYLKRPCLNIFGDSSCSPSPDLLSSIKSTSMILLI